LVIFLLKLRLLWVLKPKVGAHILPMSKVYHNRSFHLTLAPKPKTCVMALLVMAWSKFNPAFIEIIAPYRFPMGSWSGIGASIIPCWGSYYIFKTTFNCNSRVEALITDHLRFFAPNMEKYKAMQIHHV